MSQPQMAKHLGYNSGQFISNVERGLCSLPPSKVPKMAHLSGVPIEEFKNALLKDFEHNINYEIGAFSETSSTATYKAMNDHVSRFTGLV